MSEDRSPLESLVHPHLESLAPYRAPAHTATVKLDANESPWTLPAWARARLAEAVAEVALHRYPDPRAARLRALVAARFGGAEDDLVLGAGSDEVIALLVGTFGRPRGVAPVAKVLFPGPTFVMYSNTARAHGLEPVEVPLAADFQLDVDAMRAAVEVHRPNLVFLASPNNPTGSAFDEGAVEALLEVDRSVLVVIDEAYAAFSKRSLGHLVDRHPNAALMSTLSKVGLAAIRVGFCRMPAGLAAIVDKVRQPFNLNALSQRVAEIALSELTEVLDAHVAAVIAERHRLRDGLRAAGVEPHPSDANFLLCRVDDPDHFTARLAARGIAIKNLHGLGGPLAHHVRITVGTPDENTLLLEAFD
jgi:histidinol-phosphate aminotransferase